MINPGKRGESRCRSCRSSLGPFSSLSFEHPLCRFATVVCSSSRSCHFTATTLPRRRATTSFPVGTLSILFLFHPINHLSTNNMSESSNLRRSSRRREKKPEKFSVGMIVEVSRCLLLFCCSAARGSLARRRLDSAGLKKRLGQNRGFLSL